MATKLDDLKLPKRVKRVIQNLRDGRLLMLTVVNLQGGGKERVYTYHRIGNPDTERPVRSYHDTRRVPTISAEEAIASGELMASEDGLFVETSQTWRAKP